MKTKVNERTTERNVLCGVETVVASDAAAANRTNFGAALHSWVSHNVTD